MKKWFYETFDDELLSEMEKHKLIAQAEGFSVSVLAEIAVEIEAINAVPNAKLTGRGPQELNNE